MEHNQIIEKYRSLFKKLSKHYHNIVKGFDIDGIHDFRVEIKKLNAFIKLVNLATPDKQHKVPNNIKSFYNVIGNLRSLELQQQRIKSLCEDLVMAEPVSYLKELRKQKKYWRRTAKQIAEDISINDLENKFVHNAVEKIEPETVNMFIVSYKNKLEHLISLRFSVDETLHEIRKNLKDIMYNWNYVQAAACILLPEAWHERENIESAAAKLGDFHDLCISVQLLHLYYPIHIEGYERETLKKLELQLESQRAEARTEIWNSFIPIKLQLQNEKYLLQGHEIF